MVGRSSSLEKVWEAVRRAAPTNATVLITGESGVGKELVARAIHRNSLRKDEAFVQVNCAAIPEELIESELFGHEKGSFTGATEKQIGKFELAHKGTIFLDEVGDMSLKTQAKVLRVLQEGEVERIGSQQHAAGGRAGHRRHQQEAGGGHRDRALPRGPLLPPLRHPGAGAAPARAAGGHAAAGATTSCSQFSAENNLQPKTFAPAAVEALKRHAWRGNVRELKNTIERLLIMVEGTEIGPETCPRCCAGRRRPVASRGHRLPARLQGVRGARLPGPEAAREQVEHLRHRRRHRHARARTSTRSSSSTGSARRKMDEGRPPVTYADCFHSGRRSLPLPPPLS